MIGGLEFGSATPSLPVPPEIQRRFEQIYEDYRAARAQYSENLEKFKANAKKTKVKTKKVKDHPMLEVLKEVTKTLIKLNSKLGKPSKVDKMLSLSSIKFPLPQKGVLSLQEIAEELAIKYCDSLFAVKGKAKQSQLIAVSLWAQIQVLRRITEGCNVISKEKKASEESQSLLSFLTLVRRKMIEHIHSTIKCLDSGHRHCLLLPDIEDVNLFSDQLKGFLELIFHEFSSGTYGVVEAVSFWNDTYRAFLIASNSNLHLPETWDRYGKGIFAFRTKSMIEVIECFIVILDSLNRFPDPRDSPLIMQITYMAGQADLEQIYKLVETSKAMSKYQLQSSARKRLLEVSRTVSIEIIKSSFSKPIKDMQSGSALTKSLAEKLLKFGSALSKLALQCSNDEVGLPAQLLRQMLLEQALEDFHTKTRLWPQYTGIFLSGFFSKTSDFVSTEENEPILEVKSLEAGVTAPEDTTFSSMFKSLTSFRSGKASETDTVPGHSIIAFGSDESKDYGDDKHVLQMNASVTSCLRNYIDLNKKNLSSALIL